MMRATGRARPGRAGRIARAATRGAAACAALLAIALGCSDNPGQPSGNDPPETGLVFVGDLGTTLYVQEVRWWGTDRDGEVVAFNYRWVPAVPDTAFDTSWVFTTDVRDSFALPTRSDTSSYTFEVAAVDDRGAPDPSPASQAFPFRNAAPACSLTNTGVGGLPDTLFPSFTLRWTAKDPDGDETLARFLLWHDGNEANPMVIEDGAARSGTFGPRSFTAFGDRTLYVQAIDSGQRGSPPTSFHAHVLPVGGRVLLVDDMPANHGPGGFIDHPLFPRYADFFYATNLDTFYGEGAASILDLERFPIEGPTQAESLLAAFESIVWYDAIRDSLGSPSLEQVRDFLPDWLRAGGRMLLVSTYTVGTNRLRCDPVLNRCDTVPEALFPDMDPRFRRLTVGVDSVLGGERVIFGSDSIEVNRALGLEPLRLDTGFLLASVDVFEVRPSAVPLYSLAAGSVLANEDTLRAPGPIAVLNETGSGRLMLIGFPFSRMAAYGNHDAEFRKLLAILEGGPTP
jgi:hypothetical protein